MTLQTCQNSAASHQSSSLESSSDSDEPPDEKYFGTGPYANLRKGIILKKSGEKGMGLYITENIKKGTIVWKDREDGPSKKYYHIISLDKIPGLNKSEQEFAIKYGYQLDENTMLTPLTQEEVDLDYANYWNHSCNPNCLPLDETHWVAERDIKAGEELTIDYATFDSNIYECIQICFCGSTNCRKYVTRYDYRLKELQERYKDKFLPYIKEKLLKEAIH
jgi:uncharacterized protein